jgi:hypoxanthine phosphoribosyltransferase
VTHVLIDPPTIAARVAALSLDIQRGTPPGEPIHFVAVLKGGFVFLADLVRAVEAPVTCDFLGVSSYGAGQTSSGEVRLTKDLDQGVDGRHVVLVEDIVDSGATLAYLQTRLRARGPRSLRTVCLIDKPARRRVAVSIDYVGFTIEDRFVVGYGLDLDEQFRHLPYIGVFNRAHRHE